ncbi:MAG TPA: carbonic anhydrase [Terriglobales bacterium]|nr:carbonic anhydrase [Terriglobales bacterium]
MRMRALGLLLCSSLLLFAADKPKDSAPVPSADQLWQDLAAGNQRFVSGKPQAKKLTADRQKWAKTQNPLVGVLACADSRVGPELLFDKSVGDLFVVRDAGNSPDPIAVGSLEYAVAHLGTHMIVVVGHQSCGAVKAACGGGKMPTEGLNAVVSPIKKSCSLAKGDDVEPATKDHVHQSALALLKSPILKKAVDDQQLTIVEAYYSLDTGKVERLK